MAQLLVLESLDPDRDITMYINSPGGSFTSLMAIYDTMQYVRADIQTVCLGQAASAAAVLLAAGTPGQAAGAAQRPRADPPARAVRRASRASSPTWRSRPPRSSGCARLMETTLAQHTGKDAGADPQGHRPRQDPHRRRGQGLRRSSTRCSSTASCRRPERPDRRCGRDRGRSGTVSSAQARTTVDHDPLGARDPVTAATRQGHGSACRGLRGASGDMFCEHS